MGIVIYLLLWFYGICAVVPTVDFPSTSAKEESPRPDDAIHHRRSIVTEKELVAEDPTPKWICPDIPRINRVTCVCDVPHTVRCKGMILDSSLLTNLTKELADASRSTGKISLLDLSIHDLQGLPPDSFRFLKLLGLIISSGGLRTIAPEAFEGLEDSLGALGLPTNNLQTVPSNTLTNLRHLHSLDLSGNSIKILKPQQFGGLTQLQDLNLAGNGLLAIEKNAFAGLKKLRSLNLSQNNLTFSLIQKNTLSQLVYLDKLSLHSNQLNGSLAFTSFSSWPSLRSLDLSHNFITKVSFGSMKRNLNLETLDLSYNQIDIIEDHAFRNLSSLKHLDLSHNHIVAVSGWSLAHLPKLIELNMADNALFAVTADLLHQLPNLKRLDLSANDISLLQPDDVFKYTPKLINLDFADNPVNCDCTLLWFMKWLNNQAFILEEDKKSVVCATPPALENAPLIELNSSDLTCPEKNPDYYHDGTGDYELRLSDAEIILEGAKWVNDDVQLVWSIDERAVPYTCQAIHIYELQSQKEDLHQILAENIQVNCTSEGRSNPQQIVVTVPTTELLPGNTYRYCLVLLEHGTGDEESFLPGCSEALTLTHPPKIANSKPKDRKINSLTAGTMGLSLIAQTKINIEEWPCSYSLYLLLEKTVIETLYLNCSEKRHSFSNLAQGEYTICVNIEPSEDGQNYQQLILETKNISSLLLSIFTACTNVLLREESKSSAPLMLLLFTIPGLALIITLYLIGRRVWKGGGVPWKWDPRARKRAKYFLYTGESASPAASLDHLPSIGSCSPESTTRV